MWRLGWGGGDKTTGDSKDKKEYILKAQQFFNKQHLNLTALKPKRFNSCCQLSQTIQQRIHRGFTIPQKWLTYRPNFLPNLKYLRIQESSIPRTFDAADAHLHAHWHQESVRDTCKEFPSNSVKYSPGMPLVPCCAQKPVCFLHSSSAASAVDPVRALWFLPAQLALL